MLTITGALIPANPHPNFFARIDPMNPKRSENGRSYIRLYSQSTKVHG